MDKEPEVTPSSIFLSWRVANENNNCSLINFITECSYISFQGSGYSVDENITTTQKMTTGQNVIVDTAVLNLCPYTTYSCRAKVLNVAGNSSWSSAIKIDTAEDGKNGYLIIIQRCRYLSNN